MTWNIGGKFFNFCGGRRCGWGLGGNGLDGGNGGASAAKVEKKKRASELDSLIFFPPRYVPRANIFLTLTYLLWPSEPPYA